MKKNVGSQSIGAQMITAADGTAFTGSVSVSVTVDNGTQGAGGGTAPAHEGNGYHSYTPTQAETNGDHVAFTFTGTGAIPATVQVFTTFPQTGDSFARLGAPAGASVSADIATVDTNVDAILVDTGTTLPATLAALNDVSAADVNAQCDTAISDAALATAAALATVDTNVDAILIDTGTTLPATLAALNDVSVADILTTQMTEAYNADGAAPTLAEALHLVIAYLTERSVSGTTVTAKKLDGTTTAATFTLNDGTTPTSVTRSG